ncbi:uncharacterized protein LACBIDRAFT_302953 [Laccaria bicolor S238N-H82]|uniref:Predicted protein n=1 Tax=Laccaria bicolor (strain S238N-H82 / ATCC MYA-4686) TaxID=486041 RepID=B0DIP4_LACBS|nr:uncharacterized protein LACBIDRAFT_302953 [Laccaria bicolor S238N-H82]EDR05722.1 predicted protein [Laccaria bicolor S238N-H82]|eukprot:XP_001883826.1 predicted protein [Laccaria bicolor S238N-H82]
MTQPRRNEWTQKRTGWVNNDLVPSISDHMYRMAILCILSTDAQLDVPKCVMMALVHDLAEAQVGDIAPREGIPKAEKHRLEAEAMHNFIHEMLHDSPAAQRMDALWREYEAGEPPEAKFVKDKDLQPFFDSSLPNIRHPEIKSGGKDLLCLWSRGSS